MKMRESQRFDETKRTLTHNWDPCSGDLLEGCSTPVMDETRVW